MNAPRAAVALAALALVFAPSPAPADEVHSHRIVHLERGRGFALRSAGRIRQGILARELFRQALLMAARDELGLVTRDAWLGDPMPDEGLYPPLDLVASPKEDTLIELLRGFHPAQEVIASAPYRSDGGLDYNLLVAHLEEASRTRYAEWLREAGFEGVPHAWKPQAEAPEAVEALLRQMTFPAQFDAARRLHWLIRADGESPERLGALVRAYANLGVLSEIHWYPAHKVLKARALLYAHRLVARSKAPSAPAAWHRAYALSLAGLHRHALADLEAAERLAKPARAEAEQPPRPGWVGLIEALCRFQMDRLDPTRADEGHRQLARLLRVVAVEQSGAIWSSRRTHILQATTAAIEAMPECYRIHDTACANAGPRLGFRLTEAWPETWGRSIYARVADMPDLPPAARAVLSGLAGRGEVAPQREFAVRRRLIRALAEVPADADPGEPSWAALANLLAEASFLQVVRRANIQRNGLRVSPEGFLSASRPVWEDHRYRDYVESFAWDGRRRREALLRVIRIAPWGFESHAQKLCDDFHLEFPSARNDFQELGRQHLDDVARDLTCYLPIESERPAALARRILDVSPHCPAARAALIEHDWSGVEDKAVAWETECKAHACVQVALGCRYRALDRPDAAIRCFRAAIDAAPDVAFYVALAGVHLRQGDEARWQAVLEEFLQRPADELDHACAGCHLAETLMRACRFDEALPHAENAAASEAAWAMVTAARCHEALGHWKEAESLWRATSRRYREEAVLWYLFCKRTGQGDLQQARHLARHYVRSEDELGTDFNPAVAALFYRCEGEHQKALALAESRFAEFGRPLEGLRVAILAERLGDARRRDAALDEIATRGGRHGSHKPLIDLAAAIAEDLDAEEEDAIDLDEAERLAVLASDEDRRFFWQLLGDYFDLRNRPRRAIRCWKRCLAVRGRCEEAARTEAGMRLIARGHKPEVYLQEIYGEGE